MKILHAGAEVFPLVKTGGLADVLGALPQALVKLGADVRLILPGLPEILQGLEQTRTVCELGPAFGAIRVTLRRGVLAHSGVPAYVVDAPYLYRRAGSPYMDAHGFEWTDNLQRFALLGWVSAHMASAELDPDWIPDVVHAHDWHAAMACAYIAAHPGTTASTVFTVHNLAYQGLFDALDYHVLGLPARFMVPGALEFHGQFSFMKAGLTYSDRVTTVSPTFATEMATPEFGFGLDGVIRARGSQVSGILNGVDDAVWNPQTDALIAAPYSSAALSGKARCKAQLQQMLGLDVAPRAPLLALVSRLTQQKGLDLVLAALPRLVAQGAQLAVQGTGNAALEAAFVAAQERFGGKVAARIAYDEPMAHQMVAGADMILVPSRFEPCGLTQLYGLRYGTVPVVRRVGGLADTVTDVSAQAIASGQATGFAFGPANVEDLVGAVTRAVDLYRYQASWQTLMRTGMAQKFSWDVAANKYMDLYRELLAPEPLD